MAPSQKQSRGVRITHGNSFSIICRGHPRLHQSCPWAPFSMTFVGCPLQPPTSRLLASRSLSEPSPTAEKVPPDPVAENSSGYSPAQSFHFQLGELLTCSRFCSNPRTYSGQGTGDQERGIPLQPCHSTPHPHLLRGSARLTFHRVILALYWRRELPGGGGQVPQV